MRLVLQFLGFPQISLDSQPVITDRRKAVALLAYLAVNDLGHPPQKYSRAALSALLWPDYEQAKAFSNLRRTILEVRQAMGENWLIANRETVQLNPKAEIDLDIARFHDLLSQAHRQPDIPLRISLLTDTVKLYRNHFLTGFSLKDASSFNEWAFTESEELRRHLADALTLLVDSYCTLEQAEYAIPYAKRLITLDPLNESTHRQLMDVYLQAGQPSAALKQYQTCEKILRKELNLDPQLETRAFYKKIRKTQSKYVSNEKIVDEPEKAKPKHNLPVRLSSFIGREKECDEICNLLSRNRLVTVIGAGGIGKTRLAYQAAQTLLSTYSHGVWQISFNSLSDHTLVPQTIASTFGIIEGSDRSITEQLVVFLRQKSILLILDNCEHLLDACASLISTLLQNCPDLKILTTSREVIGVEGELIYNTSSLSLPEDQLVEPVQKLTQYEAIRLFGERATLALPVFALTEENASILTDICRKLDGIPLAIELAAARVDVLQLDEIFRQLNSCFDLLVSDNRMVLPRHQTMRASMDWSWGLLTPSEQNFMQELSVFAGGWTLETARAVCEGNTLNITSGLVRKSLIMVDQESGRETRYRFHEIIRQYAREKLIEAGTEEILRTRHLKYFLHLSEQAEPALIGPTQMEWHARLNDERDNIRSALEWANKTDIETGLYLSSRLHRFWESSDMREGVRRLTDCIQNSKSDSYPCAKAKALFVQGRLLGWLQQLSQANAAAQACLGLFRNCGDKQGEIDSLILLGHIGFLENTSDSAQNAAHQEQALALARSTGDIWRQAWAHFQLGWNYSGDKRSAHWEKAITLTRKVGDWQLLVDLLSILGYFVLLEGNFELAQKSLDEAALLMDDQLKDRRAKPDILYTRARLEMIRGNYNRASIYLQEMLSSAEDLGAHLNLLWCRSHLGYLALHEGNITEAHETFVETAQSFQKDKSVIGVVFSLEGIAGLCVTIDKPLIAARLIGWADATRKKIGDMRRLIEQADVDKLIAACLVNMGEVAFSDAYDEGQKMTLDDAVAYALRGS